MNQGRKSEAEAIKVFVDATKCFFPWTCGDGLSMQNEKTEVKNTEGIPSYLACLP